MSLRVLTFLIVALLAGLPALAQEDDKPQLLGLRVSSSAGSKVVVDRGESDNLAVGDSVTFSPRRGGTFTGKVVELREREAVVQLDDPNAKLEPGTRGEISIPSSRFVVERAHQTSHQYSLEEFGIDSDALRRELAELYGRFGWDDDSSAVSSDR